VAAEDTVHDRGPRLSIEYTERRAEAGIEPLVGSVGGSHDSALTVTINGRFKAEVVHRRGPGRSLETVEYATLKWGDWFSTRLLNSIGNISPAKAEANDHTPWKRKP
jgi:transposase InsO family protein